MMRASTLLDWDSGTMAPLSAPYKGVETINAMPCPKRSQFSGQPRYG